jgi:hypothetical protein
MIATEQIYAIVELHRSGQVALGVPATAALVPVARDGK